MRYMPRFSLQIFSVTVIMVTLFIDNPAFSQVSISTTTKQSPVVNALQIAIEKHQANLDRIEKSMKLTQRELDLLRDEINNDLDRRFIYAYIFGTILISIGLTSVVSIRKSIKKAEKTISDKLNKSMETKVSVEIAARIARIDPTLVPVYYPDGFERELKRLRRFGFTNLIHYKKLDKNCTEGVVIIILSGDDASNSREVSEVEQFVETHNLKIWEKIGFMFYNTTTKEFPRKIFDLHPIIDYSSSATTLSANIMTVARNVEGFWNTSGASSVSAEDTA